MAQCDCTTSGLHKNVHARNGGNKAQCILKCPMCMSILARKPSVGAGGKRATISTLKASLAPVAIQTRPRTQMDSGLRATACRILGPKCKHMHMKAEVVPATAREAQLVNMACLDQNRSCAQWAKLGECKTNAQWMSKTCRKSCGKCVAGACGDFSGDCEAWAKAGECESNKIYMHSKCAGSCGTCNKGHGTDHIPVITLNGPAQLFLGVATFSTYTDPGAKCADANFAHKVRIIGDAVHLYNPGTYEVKFECENATSVSRIVHVISDLGVGSALIKNSNNAEFEKLLSDVLAEATKTKKTDLGQVDGRFWKPFYEAMNLKYLKQTAAISGAVAVAHQSHTHAPVITTTADTSACKQRDKNKLCGYVPASPGSVFLYAKSYVHHFFVLGIGPLRGSAKASKNGTCRTFARRAAKLAAETRAQRGFF